MASEARCAGAGVAVSGVQQKRSARAVVLALVAFAAHQAFLTVDPPKEDAAGTVFEAVANVATDQTFTTPPILARAGVTLVYQLLA